MQIRKVISSLWRRWYFVALGVLLTAAACFLLQSSTPYTYKAQASLVLLPSPQSVGEKGNPYLGLGGMSEALDILTRKMSSEEFKERIKAEAGTATFTAEPDRGTSGAILLITATSDNQDETLKLLGTVIDQAPAALGELQDVLRVPEASRISTMKLLVDGTAAPESKARTQILLLSAAAGATFTVVMTVLLDGLLLSRKGRRVNAGRTGEDSEGSSPQAHTGRRKSARRPSEGKATEEPVILADETTQVVPSSHRPG